VGDSVATQTDQVRSDSIDFFHTNDYLLSSSKLDFINCDFFIDEELFLFTVKLDNPNSDVFVVVDSLNVVRYPDTVLRKSNQYLFKIPKEYQITVVAYRKDGEKHWFDIQKANTDLNEVSMKQKEWDLEKIKEQINSLK
jgi:hypothetical protein